MSAPTRPRTTRPKAFIPSEDRSLPDPAVEATIDVRRAAAVLGVSVTAIYRAVSDGRIPAIKVGQSLRIPTVRFLAELRLVPAEDDTDETDARQTGL